MNSENHRVETSGRGNKKRSKKPIIALLGLLLICGGGAAFYLLNQKAEPLTQAKSESITQNITSTPKSGKIKNLTGEQFKELYNGFAYPNTERINEDAPITGNETADRRIRAVAVQRGYKIRSAPVSDAFVDVGEGYLLQQRAAQPWLDLQKEAKADGIRLGLTAAYRSAEDQKTLFMQSMAGRNLSAATIASGSYDNEVSQILRSTAIPAFSRHHTGYTIDIACLDQPTTSFDYTKCFEWLSANNYEKTKKHGWIPSYPDGAGQQGPDPESWEYVWVGVDSLTE
jgi:LAS superfamily LD-carboxypeptidase LdcB